MVAKACTRCQATFTAKKPGQTMCSSCFKTGKLAGLENDAPDTTKCVNPACGKAHTPTRTNTARTCSIECRRQMLQASKAVVNSKGEKESRAAQEAELSRAATESEAKKHEQAQQAEAKQRVTKEQAKQAAAEARQAQETARQTKLALEKEARLTRLAEEKAARDSKRIETEAKQRAERAEREKTAAETRARESREAREQMETMTTNIVTAINNQLLALQSSLPALNNNGSGPHNDGSQAQMQPPSYTAMAPPQWSMTGIPQVHAQQPQHTTMAPPQWQTPGPTWGWPASTMPMAMPPATYRGPNTAVPTIYVMPPNTMTAPVPSHPSPPYYAHVGPYGYGWPG